MKTETQTASQALEKYLAEKMKGKQNGELDFNQICKDFPAILRYDLLKELRTHKGTSVIVGRRGSSTRICWPAITENAPAAAIKRRVSRQIVPIPTGNITGLKINIGGIEKFIPLVVEVV